VLDDTAYNIDDFSWIDTRDSSTLVKKLIWSKETLCPLKNTLVARCITLKTIQFS
jgi:hypothetical protein